MHSNGWRALVLIAAVLTTALGAPAAAQTSAVAVRVIVDIPTVVTVGQTGVAGQIVVENLTGGDLPVRVTQITYDPACRNLSLPCDATDPGVFVLGGTATGTGGVCLGHQFVVLGNPVTGRYTFLPQAPVNLPPAGSPDSACPIAFTFDVARMPTTQAQTPPPTALTRAIASVSVQRGADGSTNIGTANITVRSAWPGRYVPLTPARILDTRDGTGGISAPVGPESTVSVQVAGRGGVPSTGVTAVAMNVTGTQPTADVFLTLYPAGSPRPLAANLNLSPGKTVPNLVVVKLGTGGQVDMFNSAGSTHVIYDVAGWFSESPSGSDGRFHPLTPARILDTRTGTGGSSVRLGPGASLDLELAGQGGLPATGAEAVVMNVAVTNTTATSFLTVHPAGLDRPLAANLNWAAGDTVGNRVIARVGAGGRVTLYNDAGETDIVVDTNGWFTDGSMAGPTGPYTPLAPARILDTRTGAGGLSGPIPAGASVDVQVTGQGGVPATGVGAVILNATVVSPAGPGFITVSPAGTDLPLASDLNYAAGEVRPNLVVVKLGAGGKVSLYTSTETEVVFDVAGFFAMA